MLKLGQSAISHSVRQLETIWNVRLFERAAQGVRLTTIGAKLAKRLQFGFEEIQLGLEEALSNQAAAVVTILVSTSFQSWKFVDEVLFPVCSPAWLAEQVPLNQPSDLLTRPLIHLEEHYHPRFNWPQYFQHYSLQLNATREDVSFNDYSIVVQAAIEGQGIVLGWHHIAQPLIEQGKLVAPLKNAFKHLPRFM